jgi:hypothetical protein
MIVGLDHIPTTCEKGDSSPNGPSQWEVSSVIGTFRPSDPQVRVQYQDHT